jgi:hypothetical protein
MRLKTNMIAAVSALALLGVATAASANVAVLGESSSYTLSVVDSAAGLGAGPFGTISIFELSANSLRITVDLNDPTYKFHSANDTNHPALAFNLTGSPAITYSFIDPVGGLVDQAVDGKFVDGGTGSAPPFGIFSYSLDYKKLTAKGQPATPFAGPLVFSITSLAGLDITSFTGNHNPYGGPDIYFTSDLIGPNGATGNVGALYNVPENPGGGPVPEPASWAFMIMGFGGVGAMMRRRRAVLVTA